MKGELTLHEDLVFLGTFDGTVIDGARNLLIGTFANIKANVKSESVVISGTVTGDIDGSEQIVLRRTACLHGQLNGGHLWVEDGTNLEDA